MDESTIGRAIEPDRVGLAHQVSQRCDLAAGLSNQQIASTLYMNTRSVESHLTKIYREFGVRSRAQFVGALSRRGERAESA